MGPFGLVGVSTTSLEGAHLVVVDLVVHLVAQRVGNFSDRPWGISVILVNVCFITDAFSRMIVGWRVAGHMRTEMVLDAVEMARWQRGTRLEDLRCHSDAGSQFTSIRYGERLDEIGAQPSIGSIGDSYDNALAESVNALYRTELVRGPGRGPWKTIDDLELGTLS